MKWLIRLVLALAAHGVLLVIAALLFEKISPFSARVALGHRIS